MEDLNGRNVEILTMKIALDVSCIAISGYLGDNTKAMLRERADVLAHVHVGDTFNHKASSGLRYILNPPATQAARASEEWKGRSSSRPRASRLSPPSPPGCAASI
jgi:sugar phosphate isomerase/epimerase